MAFFPPASGARPLPVARRGFASKPPEALLSPLRPAEGGRDHPSPNTQTLPHPKPEHQRCGHTPAQGASPGQTTDRRRSYVYHTSPTHPTPSSPQRGAGMERRVKRCCSEHRATRRTRSNLRFAPAGQRNPHTSAPDTRHHPAAVAAAFLPLGLSGFPAAVRADHTTHSARTTPRPNLFSPQ
jgi:hypothetical protein